MVGLYTHFFVMVYVGEYDVLIIHSKVSVELCPSLLREREVFTVKYWRVSARFIPVFDARNADEM